MFKCRVCNEKIQVDINIFTSGGLKTAGETQFCELCDTIIQFRRHKAMNILPTYLNYLETAYHTQINRKLLKKVHNLTQEI